MASRSGGFGTSLAPFGAGAPSDLSVYEIGDPPIKPVVAPAPGVMPQPVIPAPIVPPVTYTPAAPAPAYDPAYLAMRAALGVPIKGVAVPAAPAAPAPAPAAAPAPTYDPAYLAMRALMGVPIKGVK